MNTYLIFAFSAGPSSKIQAYTTRDPKLKALWRPKTEKLQSFDPEVRLRVTYAGIINGVVPFSLGFQLNLVGV